MSKRMLSLILVIALLATLATGFALSSTAKAETEKTKITLMTWAGGGQKTADEANRDAFNASQDKIELTVEFVPDDYNAKLNTLIAAGTPPDLGLLNTVDMVNRGYDQGTVADITELTTKLWGAEMSADRFVPNALFTYNGKVMGATAGVEVFMLYYNKQLFEESAVVAPTDAKKPWTWDEFLAAAKRLTIDKNGKHADEEGFDAGENGANIKQYGVEAPTWTLALESLLRSNNDTDATFLSRDGKELNVTKPEGLEVIQAVADLINVHHVSPSVAALKAFNVGSSSLLMNGQLAMFISGTWTMASLGDENYVAGYAPVPMFKHPSNSIWGAPIVVFEKSQNKEAAVEYLKYYVNPETAIGPSAAGSWMPSLKDWYTDPDKMATWLDNPRHPADFNSLIGAIATEIAVVPEFYVIKNNQEIVEQIIAPALEPLWLGDVKTAEEALKDVQSLVEMDDLLQGAWQ